MRVVDTILDLVSGTPKMTVIWSVSLSGLLVLVCVLLVALIVVYRSKGAARDLRRNTERNKNIDPDIDSKLYDTNLTIQSTMSLEDMDADNPDIIPDQLTLCKYFCALPAITFLKFYST